MDHAHSAHGHGQAAVATAPKDMSHGQQHPLGIYFKIWILLFVLSACSYMVDYLGFQGFARWTLIITFMWLKAGFIVAIFMHMRWERPALILAILVPPLLLAVLVGLMHIESDYTFWTRIIFFGPETPTLTEHGVEAAAGAVAH
jgi:cytochrome c oxidase subunit IV